MSRSTYNPWLHRFAVLTALATFALLGVGGLVTSHGVGMAVPDWPTTYGYNMFFFPFSRWTGGIFYEHSHRLVASIVGLLVVFLTRWLGGKASRGPLAVIGLLEILAGGLLLALKPESNGAGHFLSGIGGVVLLAAFAPSFVAACEDFLTQRTRSFSQRNAETNGFAAFAKTLAASALNPALGIWLGLRRAVWTRNEPAPGRLPALGWWAFGLVQLQGLLGGLRVVLFKDEIGIFHAALAQVFFALVCVIAILTSRWWAERRAPSRRVSQFEADDQRAEAVLGPPIRRLFLLTTILIFLQLILGATMRHQHAGLAIPDFPLAHGKLWPAMDAASIQNYNARRMETTAANPITAFQIALQMAHRLLALAILVCVGVVAWRIGAPASGTARHRNDHQRAVPEAGAPLRRLAFFWLTLILIQVGLGAWTIWSNKAADVATAHVLVGALSLVTGVVGCLICFRRFARVTEAQGAPVSTVSCSQRPVTAINS